MIMGEGKALIHYRDLLRALGQLELDSHSRLIVHAAPDLSRHIAGGGESLLGALLACSEALLMPAFTSTTEIVPPFGPENNALAYGEDDAANLYADIFTADLPVDSGLGELAEIFRAYPESDRSTHPLLSFSATGAAESLEHQTLDTPLAPIDWMAEYDADVLLIGLDQRANFSLHLAERRAGRKTFVRWALSEAGVVTCTNMPGCSEGFNAIDERLSGEVRITAIGPVALQAIALRDLLNIAAGWIHEDPRALLCERPACPHCSAVRADLRQTGGANREPSDEDPELEQGL
jgi:aminoglycoside 3-N-acetyltransferase